MVRYKTLLRLFMVKTWGFFIYINFSSKANQRMCCSCLLKIRDSKAKAMLLEALSFLIFTFGFGGCFTNLTFLMLIKLEFFFFFVFVYKKT